VQIEGRGNGIKTNVVNNVEIAKALERPPDCKFCYLHHLLVCWATYKCICPVMNWSMYGGLCYPPTCRQMQQGKASCVHADLVKFYGCELGAQTKYDKKDGTSIVNGAHDTSKLCELLEVCSLFMSLQAPEFAVLSQSACLDALMSR